MKTNVITGGDHDQAMPLTAPAHAVAKIRW